jgi:hypothetical protein
MRRGNYTEKARRDAGRWHLIHLRTMKCRRRVAARMYDESQIGYTSKIFFVYDYVLRQ